MAEHKLSRAHLVLRNATIVALECVVLQAEKRPAVDLTTIRFAQAQLNEIRQDDVFSDFETVSTWIKSVRKRWLFEDNNK